MPGTEHVMFGHWTCSACGRESIPEQDTLCPRCGDPRAIPQPAADQYQQVAWRCMSCGARNSMQDTICTSCNIDPDDEVEWKPNRLAGFSGLKRFQKVLLIGAGVLVCLFLYWIWSLRVHGVTGKVSAQNWSHTVHLYRWQPVQTGDWAPLPIRDEEVLPVAGKGGAGRIEVTKCYQKHSHYEQYQCGYRTEFYNEKCDYHRRQNNPNCTELKTREVPKYCDRSIKAEWCDYNTQDWVRDETRTQTATGTDAATMRWPEVEPQGDLEKIEKVGHWSVEVNYRHRGQSQTHRVSLRKPEQFDRWPLGGAAIVRVENRGTVRSVRPK